ncbi:efflux RND transporter periplasmic adaptor subunit [Flammeovirga kamogawensis]|uniref:Efflux RND transporter periplasmic adaptor subunit n=2 Tax=Flammeovirga kamogawensis TaxID=373891 RepID=A0ABX8H1G2_9BACT|nr:efflux RND transporter periplasmic adaptor subunit [Flammeovirga kamogawensis]TRX70086.1 efflux RND transporter periplasmic adaptor subunit [Flammeovirga kamogawensis]
MVLFLSSCGTETSEDAHEHGAGHEHGEAEEHGEHEEEVHLSMLQYKSMDMEVGKMPTMHIGDYVLTNGTLEVPPQNEAAVTAVIGANVISIKVIEGEKIKKGQVLAYLNHPNLIRLQTDYTSKWNQLKFMEEDYKRQKKLFDENVGSGREYQKSSATYYAMRGDVKGLEAQLKMLRLNLKRIQEGHIYENVPVVSPLSGYIKLVEVKTGQYVDPQKELFEVINLDDIHVDLMVYEKDIAKVEVGQNVYFKTEIKPDVAMRAKIFNIGKSFENDPKAIHLHADIIDQKDELLPGTYVRGKIMVNDKLTLALPEEALVQEGDKMYFFTAEIEGNEWSFKPQEVIVGSKDNGFAQVKLLKEINSDAKVALNNAYYLMAEMKKSEAEHVH